MTDTEIIVLLGSNKKLAFDHIFEMYSKMVYNVCLNFLQLQEDAEEITQDVFVDIYNKIESFNQESTLKTWVYKIAINKSRERIRYQNRKKRFGIFISISSEKENEYLISDHPGIEEDQREKANLLQVEIKKLNDKQRTAFTLYHMEGLSYKEIAETMEISLGAIESLIFRAKKNLKKGLKNMNS